MSLQDSLNTIIDQVVDEEALWDGAYKIPWNDPDFSQRMLAEHLSQEHDLASRKREMIRTQVRWIHEHICNSTPAKLLDIGCGPGLYIEQFAALDYDCCGIDFSPASIEYARSQLGDKAKTGRVCKIHFAHAEVTGRVCKIHFAHAEVTGNLMKGCLQSYNPV